jgi:hypothetical protein
MGVATANCAGRVQDSLAFTASSTGCTHPVDVDRGGRGLRCRSARVTPIFDQLRDEGVNAEVAPSQTASLRREGSSRHRRLADTADTVEVCALPGPAADPVAHQHPVPEKADQSPGAMQRPAAVRGPQATLPRPTHTRRRHTCHQQFPNGYRRI